MLSKPARKIGSNNRSITGKRPSQKTSRSQHFESALERDYLLLQEWDDTVADYGVQPVTIYYDNDGRSARYTPDVIVHYRPESTKKPTLVEIKYEAELLEKQAQYAARFKAAADYASSNGYEFVIITERTIRTTYLYNIKFLDSYRQHPLDQALAETIISKFDAGKKLSALQLQTGGSDEKMLFVVWQLVAAKILSCDLQQKIMMTSLLWKP
jgi:hypothetical protein